MFSIQKLQSLCSADTLHGERTATPFVSSGRVCATNGLAILCVRDPDLASSIQNEGPSLRLVDEMAWTKKERIVSLLLLRSFLRRNRRRVRGCRDGRKRELVTIDGATLDAKLLRKYLPRGVETVRLSHCTTREWFSRQLREPPALRIRADNWELIIMSVVDEKPAARDMFKPARKGPRMNSAGGAG